MPEWAAGQAVWPPIKPSLRSDILSTKQESEKKNTDKKERINKRRNQVQPYPKVHIGREYIKHLSENHGDNIHVIARICIVPEYICQNQLHSCCPTWRIYWQCDHSPSPNTFQNRLCVLCDAHEAGKGQTDRPTDMKLGLSSMVTHGARHHLYVHSNHAKPKTLWMSKARKYHLQARERIVLFICTRITGQSHSTASSISSALSSLPARVAGLAAMGARQQRCQWTTSVTTTESTEMETV